MSHAALAFTVAIAIACIPLAGWASNLTLHRLSGTRLKVRLISVVLNTEGHFMRGPGTSWRNPSLEFLARGVRQDLYGVLANIRQQGGNDRIDMIREVESTLDEPRRRSSENARIKAAAEHLKLLGIGTETVPDYAVSVPGNWNLGEG